MQHRTVKRATWKLPVIIIINSSRK
jgi:hypothetical protein